MYAVYVLSAENNMRHSAKALRFYNINYNSTVDNSMENAILNFS